MWEVKKNEERLKDCGSLVSFLVQGGLAMDGLRVLSSSCESRMQSAFSERLIKFS